MRTPLLLAAVLLAVSAAPASAGLRSFHSPTGNIGCIISTGGGSPAEVRCDIAQHTWKTPKRPGSCHLSYGDSVGLTATGPAFFVCHGDTALHQGRVLNYDSSITYGGFYCVSRFTGLSCKNNHRHMFFISRQSISLG